MKTVEQSPADHRINPLDFLQLDALLSEEERLIRDSVRRFVSDLVLPQIADWFEAGIFPREIAVELGRLGLLGMQIQGYGCIGATGVQYGLTAMELEAGDSGFRSFVSVQGTLVMFAIWTYGSEEQKEELLPRMAKGEVLGCFGLTESDAGSDPASMRTWAKRDGQDWILSGSKMWITSGGLADVALVWAQTDGGVRGFLVPKSAKGFSTADVGRKLSLRASVTSELILDEVRLPADAVLPGAFGLNGPLSCLNEARFGIVWGAMGAARTCFETAVEYAQTRMQFDRPIGSFQLTQQKLANMLIELNKGMLLALHLGRMKDDGRLLPEHVSMGKLNNVREALAIAREARTILGANGITLEYPVLRHANNLESVLTYEGTSEIHSLILGHAVTGLRAFD